jgi:hypothetical protein
MILSQPKSSQKMQRLNLLVTKIGDAVTLEPLAKPQIRADLFCKAVQKKREAGGHFCQLCIAVHNCHELSLAASG